MSSTSTSVNKVLIIGPSWVGDMVMAQSLFIALKKNNPQVIIDVLALDWTRPILERMPEVRKAIIMPITHGVFGWRERKKIGRSLQSEAYDQAIVLPNSWKSALIPWFAKIPTRTGWLGEMRFGLLNDSRKLSKQALPMMVQRFVSLAYPASQSRYAPSYPEPKLKTIHLDHDFVPKLMPSQKRLILCPGAEFGPAKQWPVEHFAHVAKHYAEKDWQILIMGSKADAYTAEGILSNIPQEFHSKIVNLTGKTTLAQAIDVLGAASCVVSNDSGLMHIAAAMQKPLVAVYGPTSPSFTPPLSSQAKIAQIDIECSPCFERACPLKHQHCMTHLLPDMIIQEINGLTESHD